MNFNFLVKEMRNGEFPLEMIKTRFINIKDMDVYTVDNSSSDGKKKLDNEYDKQMFEGFQTRLSKHKVPDSKIKHECFETTWDTKKHGYPVRYQYKFCESCKDYFDKSIAVFNNETYECEVIKFDY